MTSSMLVSKEDLSFLIHSWEDGEWKAASIALLTGADAGCEIWAVTNGVSEDWLLELNKLVRQLDELKSDYNNRQCIYNLDSYNECTYEPFYIQNTFELT
jgi:hypothetical protein